MALTKTLRIPWGVFKVEEDLECCKWLDLWYSSFYARITIFEQPTASFFMFLCPSVWNNSAFTGRMFVKFDK